MNPITGSQYIPVPSKQAPVKCKLRFPLPGLEAEYVDGGRSIKFSWTRLGDEIDEAAARDAQCIAGWSDTGYGFFGFSSRHVGMTAWDASWYCWKSCE